MLATVDELDKTLKSSYFEIKTKPCVVTTSYYFRRWQRRMAQKLMFLCCKTGVGQSGKVVVTLTFKHFLILDTIHRWSGVSTHFTQTTEKIENIYSHSTLREKDQIISAVIWP